MGGGAENYNLGLSCCFVFLVTRLHLGATQEPTQGHPIITKDAPSDFITQEFTRSPVSRTRDEGQIYIYYYKSQYLNK